MHAMRSSLVLTLAVALGCGAAPVAPARSSSQAAAPPAPRMIASFELPGPFETLCAGIEATELGPEGEGFDALTCAEDEPQSVHHVLEEPRAPFLEATFAGSYSEGWEDAGGNFLAVRTSRGWFVQLVALDAVPGGAGLIENPVYDPTDLGVTTASGSPRLLARFVRGTRADYQYAGPEEGDDGPLSADLETFAWVCAAPADRVRCAEVQLGAELEREHLVHVERNEHRVWTSELTLEAGDRTTLIRSGQLPDGLAPRETLVLDLDR
jgi:hypothetical protein